MALRIVLDMQGTAEGALGRSYSSRPLNRRTAERLRDKIERVSYRARQANPSDASKRYRLPPGTVSAFACASAEQLIDLATAVTLLRQENSLTPSANAERAISKLRTSNGGAHAR